MAQIIKVDSQLSINGLLGLQSNLAEGVWKEKVGKAQRGGNTQCQKRLLFYCSGFYVCFEGKIMLHRF